MNKKKIINDPVYGFITIPSDLIYDLISHPYFQRLRYIKQLGMTHLVYPGALHTRFHHALGAMHLMGLSLEVLRNKGHVISAEEEEAATIALLLHDIGHGPFSHSLEHTLARGIQHEDISQLIMNKLNEEFDGKLNLALLIFKNQYHRAFFNQLISGQVDLDRMDYLNRDSFFTGVSEGVISFDRIIKMFNLVNDELVIEEKGIYSVEKFLIARRLMYWQVYLHKTVIAAEQLLVKILERAKELSSKGHILFATPALQHFLQNDVNGSNFFNEEIHLNKFTQLDDQDIHAAIKVWADSNDEILARMCRMLKARRLYKVEITNEEPDHNRVKQLTENTKNKLGLNEKEISYFVFTDTIKNRAYNMSTANTNILMKTGKLVDIAKASDLSNIQSLDRTVEKHILCYTKEF
ncbi:HD domain-containing protein [Pedobacter montanisoli]|uniref:HD domain-containing protein n=1 Tax=Pedobacter montanisoli TaxID=2923277 RepID=A0ABS9ZT45_9SPHI|nr:HD domain-containing protein [Pedobacter montanisoli]MCJ0741761.1 HD domain-containing protein [Pedobacter montanisoli]